MTDHGDDIHDDTAGGDPAEGQDAGRDTLDAMLSRVPPEVGLYLRDLLRGLEAEAGNARARAVRERELLQADIDRLRMFASGVKAKLDTAKSELKSARREATAAAADLAAARAEVASLQSAAQGRGAGWRNR